MVAVAAAPSAAALGGSAGSGGGCGDGRALSPCTLAALTGGHHGNAVVAVVIVALVHAIDDDDSGRGGGGHRLVDDRGGPITHTIASERSGLAPSLAHSSSFPPCPPLIFLHLSLERQECVEAADEEPHQRADHAGAHGAPEQVRHHEFVGPVGAAGGRGGGDQAAGSRGAGGVVAPVVGRRRRHGRVGLVRLTYGLRLG